MATVSRVWCIFFGASLIEHFERLAGQITSRKNATVVTKQAVGLNFQSVVTALCQIFQPIKDKGHDSYMLCEPWLLEQL
jgi:hypothetical protein